MDKIPDKAIALAVSAVLVIPKVRRGTVYISPKLTVKATAQRRIDKRDNFATLLVTVGRPNHAERRFIRLCKKAGEPLPVKKVQLKFWPKKK